MILDELLGILGERWVSGELLSDLLGFPGNQTAKPGHEVDELRCLLWAIPEGDAVIIALSQTPLAVVS